MPLRTAVQMVFAALAAGIPAIPAVTKHLFQRELKINVELLLLLVEAEETLMLKMGYFLGYPYGYMQ